MLSHISCLPTYRFFLTASLERKKSVICFGGCVIISNYLSFSCYESCDRVQWKVLLKTGCHATVHWLKKDLLLFHHNSEIWGIAVVLTYKACRRFQAHFKLKAMRIWHGFQCRLHKLVLLLVPTRKDLCPFNLLSIWFLMLLYAAEFLANI